MRSTSAIARFLGVGRQTVRNALLKYGIAESQSQGNPFTHNPSDLQPTGEDNTGDLSLPPSDDPESLHIPDPLLNPLPPEPDATVPQPPPIPTHQAAVSNRGPISAISDENLDNIIQMLRCQYARAGITILHGMLRNLGLHIPRTRIQASLLRIDPVQRVFERIRIRRRVYNVPGPNSLWHHDGQHGERFNTFPANYKIPLLTDYLKNAGLIRWGIVIHGFIDGYSRLIAALRASNNNTGDTVLDLFLTAATIFGVPSRLRGDHGVENIKVAAWMENFRGTARGSYIWGRYEFMIIFPTFPPSYLAYKFTRSVHNVRIERLWVDITAQLGAAWAEEFTNLEIHHGLDINNVYHIWLLHAIFLPILNQQLTFFAESWNHHTIQIRHGRNRSPLDMFGFDMLVHGVRGDAIRGNDIELAPSELEVYGIDWAAYQDDRILQSVRHHAQGEQASSWIGQTGPPPNLNEVALHPPQAPPADHTGRFISDLAGIVTGSSEDSSISGAWNRGYAFAHATFGNIF